MSTDPLQQLFAGARAVAGTYYPGRVPLSVTVRFTDGGPPLAVPVPAGPAAPDDTPEQAPKSLRVVNDILAVLAEVRRPLTCTRVLSEMARKGVEWSERTVADALARLAEDGTLSNPKDPKRPGYCLPEYDDRL